MLIENTISMKPNRINHDADKLWFVFNYYLLKEKILCKNLSNQFFDYLIPKVNVIENDRNKVINLFPGYGFANLPLSKLSSLKYTKGIKSILGQGNDFSSVPTEYIAFLTQECEKSKSSPIIVKPNVGDVVKINKGPFKDNLAKVIHLDKNKRIGVMMRLLSREFTFDIEPEYLTQNY